MKLHGPLIFSQKCIYLYNAYSKKRVDISLWNNEMGFDNDNSSINGFICGMVQFKQNLIPMKWFE